MRIATLALVAIPLLAGCALPPAVTVASFVADGVSYVATGKSTTDHAISAVAREDCALLRAVQDREICDPDGEVLVELVGAEPSPDDWADPGDLHLYKGGSTTFSGPANSVQTEQARR